MSQSQPTQQDSREQFRPLVEPLKDYPVYAGELERMLQELVEIDRRTCRLEKLFAGVLEGVTALEKTVAGCREQWQPLG